MDNVTVIGGSGFVGSHTADELSRRGYKVTILDKNESRWLRKDQNMIVGDVLDVKTLTRATDGARFLYHFSSISDINECHDHPLDTINLNVMGVANALEVANRVGVERFIYASTMYVYSPYGSFYRASKQSAEILIEAFEERYGISYTLLRYGSLYGPRAQEWNGLRQYVNQIVRHGKISYSGTGSERREYIHVVDAARLSVDVLDNLHENEAITVTGSQVLKSSELISMIFEISGMEENATYTMGNEGGVKGIHYGMTPYRYTPKQAKKIVPREFIDIGQGVLDVVKEIHEEIDIGL